MSINTFGIREQDLINSGRTSEIQHANRKKSLYTMLYYYRVKYKSLCTIISFSEYEIHSNIDHYLYFDTRTKSFYLNPFNNFYIFFKKFKEALNANKKFIIIPIALRVSGISPENIANHMNILIFDCFTLEFELFEPYGDINNIHNFDIMFKIEFNKYLMIDKSKYDTSDNIIHKTFNNKCIKYFPTLSFCPKYSFQALDELIINKDRIIKYLGGYCGIWSMWWINYRLGHPYIDRETLIKYAIKSFTPDPTNTEKTKDIGLFIQDYARIMMVINNVILKYPTDEERDKEFTRLINNMEVDSGTIDNRPVMSDIED
jgi:hypothetical protein